MTIFFISKVPEIWFNLTIGQDVLTEEYSWGC